MRRATVLCILVLAAAQATHAQTALGTAFTYQGRLENAGSLANGVHDLRFRLYDALIGGTQVATTVCFNNVIVADGLFTVPLDFGAQFDGQERFLEIDVRADSGRDCTNSAGFVVLSPRHALTAAPNALNADRLDGLDSTAFLQSIPVPLTLSGTSATHIIRGENASAGSGVSGVFGSASAGSGATSGVYGQSDSTNGRGVFGEATSLTGFTYGGRFANASTDGRAVYGSVSAATGTTYGVFGSSASDSGTGVYGGATSTSGFNFGMHGQTASSSGIGVFGEAIGTSGVNYGVYGQSASTSGRGVFGEATAATGTNYGGRFISASTGGSGVYGEATAASGTNYGGRFVSASTSGKGVYGEATAASGSTYGGWFESASTSGRGVIGKATATSGATYAVVGQSDSTSGRGVFGLATATTGTNYGVYGRSDSDDGSGVYGVATSTSPFDGTRHYGVYGSASGPQAFAVYGLNTDSTFASPAVVGENNAGAYGVFAYGRLGASGTKEFVIDHPLDPENKYLKHYCTEGPEPQNVYNGVVTTGADSKAWIELPDYFSAINTEYRYQLTVVDDTEGPGFVQVKIARKIKGNGFMIMTSVPNVEVSWEVKARRNDLWVQKYGAPVEVDKPEHERGKYQHPALYDLPPENGMNYRAERSERAPRPASSDEK